MESLELGRLYERCRQVAHARALRMLGDEQAAFDVVQDAFMRVLRHRDKISEHAEPRGWILRIVTNLCLDEMRKRRSRESVCRVGVQERAVSNHPAFGPMMSYETSRIREHIRESLATLDAHHHDVFIMREMEGLSYQQIADASACPKGTVMSRLFHARRKLRRELRVRLELEAHERTGRRAASRASVRRVAGDRRESGALAG